MVNHKKRVQRKIKRDVKRKVAAVRAKQQQQQQANKNMDMIKAMMVMMNGGKQPASNDQLERYRHIEEEQKAKNELKKQETRYKDEINNLKKQHQEEIKKATIAKLGRDKELQENMNKLEKEKLEEAAKIDEMLKEKQLTKAQADAEKARIERNFRLRKAELDAMILGYDKHAAETENEIQKQEYLNALAKNEIGNIKKAIGYNEIAQKYNDLLEKFNHNSDKIKVLSQVKPDKAQNIKEVLNILNATQDVIKATIIPLLYKHKDANDAEEILKELGLDNALQNANKIANDLTKTLNQKNVNLKILENKAKELEKLKLNEPKLKDEITRIDEAIDQYTFKYIKNPETGEFIREADANGNAIPIDIDKEISDKQKQYNQLKIEKEVKQAELNREIKKKVKVVELQAENDRLDAENKVLQQQIDAPETEEDKQKMQNAINERVKYMKEQQLLGQRSKTKDAEADARFAQMQANALKSEAIEKSEKDIEEEMLKTAEYEELKRKREELLNAQRTAIRKKKELDIQHQLQESFANPTSIDEATALFTAAIDKMNENTLEMQREAEYVNMKNKNLRTAVSNDPATYSIVDDILQSYGHHIDSPDWYHNNLKTREQVDAMSRVFNRVASVAYDAKKEEWNPERVEALKNNDENITSELEIMFPPPSTEGEQK